MRKKAWIVSVNMGYGHQRTAYPLKEFASRGEIINANDYKGIPEKDRNIWESSRRFYEFISRFKRVPLVGELAFYLFNKLQEIPTYYPSRDLSRPNASLKKIFSLIKKGWGRHFISSLSRGKLPFVSTFFIPAFMAEQFEYPGEIYCIVCDADISRAWASLDAKKSRIKYFAPDSWVANRLKLYGVKEENIYLTGYPLPMENIGSRKQEKVKEDLRNRLYNLDPKRIYYKDYEPLIMDQIGRLPKESDHTFTIAFSIGGAGAQSDIVMDYIRSLEEKIKASEIKVILSAGMRKEVKECFYSAIKGMGLENKIDIIYEKNVWKYFEKFNQALRKTDILWTKPSELSFYSGLGIPLIIAPSIGSQEDYNRRWLLSTGSGIVQENPKYADQWLFDYLESGRFAKSALRGFIEINNLGAYNIRDVIFKK
ncbi:MAG: hypothetical protein A2427_03385 [Candidatus Nealsonbacteria bacterium RIFOXYC1_FULL_40_7]|uniref:DUF6938 domain-containing protein n=1 Tax=Candidatus Nealsonbacteria bacterium RIFOXYC1_FULL_40_7 TaxID=1801678 RepID=A0A1G2ERT7_9BACT|nr:MAG: hypothetical protein A2427_03385 [Candidatus Nealsonbacteria bacterium RIFOXYC1_FULL_40_7]OGZ28542.1 MAG: hypothetical protein A2562_03595 [Candidatus Nealsonbacteria bacterium RIFOXYD1_FULL_39_11]